MRGIRYLVRDEPTGRRFVEIQWMDNTFYVRAGYPGDTGTVEAGELMTAEKVEEVVRARVASLIAEGYVEAAPPLY
jgi:hypothetical protein